MFLGFSVYILCVCVPKGVKGLGFGKRRRGNVNKVVVGKKKKGKCTCVLEHINKLINCTQC